MHHRRHHRRRQRIRDRLRHRLRHRRLRHHQVCFFVYFFDFDVTRL